jgi:hypothetical protein
MSRAGFGKVNRRRCHFGQFKVVSDFRKSSRKRPTIGVFRAAGHSRMLA